MFSQELRLRYDAGGEFAWFAGVNYFDEEGLDGSPIQWDERVALAQLTGQLHMGGFGSGLPTNHPAPYAYFGDSLFINPLLLQGAIASISGGNLLYNYFGGDAPFLQALAANLKPSHLEQQYNRQALTSWDVFTDFTWRASEQWEFSLGLRYTEDEKDVFYSSQVNNGRSVLGGILGAAQLAASGDPFDVFVASILLGGLTSPTVLTDPVTPFTPLFGLTFQPTLNNGSTESISASDDGVTWRLTALYRATEDLNFYANYGRGRRPLAVAALSPSTPYGSARFDFVPAETVDSYEVGFKGSFFDRALRLDGALYHYKYENFQTVVQVGTTFITSNAGEASATGVEMQGVWSPTDNFSFFGTYAYNNGRFEGGAYDGNRFRLSPDHAFSLGMDVQWPFLGGEVYFRPTYTWQSKVFFDDNNDEAFFQQAPPKFVADNIIDEFQESYGLLNARLGFTPGEGNWEVELYADNLLDYRYVIDAGNTGDAFGMATWIPGPPRMVGVSVRIRR
jgi:outer membrane receptor protein involved in Fe transport